MSANRTDLNSFKQQALEFTNKENMDGSCSDAMKGSDIFVGLSLGGIVSQEMVSSMNTDPIIFAMANPTPEIMPSEALEAGARVVGTGRSDFPNQINNSLAFPGIFRGLLDAKAPAVTTSMKIAASKAIASLITEPSEDLIIPSTLDERVVPVVSAAVRSA